MVDSDEIDHDAGYNELTLLEKRNRNIERNKSFFLSLFGSSTSKPIDSSESVAVVESSNATSHKVARFQLDSFICDEEKKREDIVTSLSAYYPHRRDVIQKLVGYLHPVSVCKGCTYFQFFASISVLASKLDAIESREVISQSMHPSYNDATCMLNVILQ